MPIRVVMPAEDCELKLADALKDSDELRKLLLKNGVAVLADIHFGRRNPGDPEQHIRLSYATSKENIIEGIRRMKAVMGSKDSKDGTLTW